MDKAMSSHFNSYEEPQVMSGGVFARAAIVGPLVTYSEQEL